MLLHHLFVTCFHKFRIYYFFAKIFLFSFKVAAQCLFFLKINSYRYIFDLLRRILPCLKRKTEKKSQILGFRIRENMSRTRYFLPFSNVENSRSLHQHDFQFGLETMLAKVLQRPIPVVVIIITKVFSTGMDFCPQFTVEDHTHIMFCTLPWHHLDLHRFKSRITKSTKRKGKKD